MSNKTQRIFEASIEYLQKGYSIIPVGQDKKPLLNWKEFQTRIATEEEVSEWLKKWPEMNIGIVCGKISGITVLDLDVGHEKSTPITAFPETLTHQTPSLGVHLVYKYIEGFTISANQFPQFPHTDMRSDTGFIVAPPSVTEKGEYKVIKDIPLADFPIHLFGDVKTTKKKRSLKSLTAVSEGGRNDALASLIGKLLMTEKKENWDTSVFPAVMQMNASYNPPLSMSEVVAIWDSVCKLEMKRLDGEPKSDNEEEAEILSQFTKNSVNGTFELAQYIVKKFNIITVGEIEREMYVYQDGMYKLAQNEIIAPEIQRILKNKVTKNAQTETYHKIANATAKPRSVFSSASTNLIPLKNGVYDTATKKILPHSPDYRFTFQFPVTYNPEALCPLSVKFMQDILTEEQILTIQEWMGYYFYRKYAFKKAIIFVGEGDTGKTTLLELITHLLGRENISSISLQKMTGDKFAGAQMYEKHGNIVDELSAKDIHDTGQFKIATGGGSIQGEYKFGNQFLFQNYSKLTFACNKIPDVKEMDDQAYFNRWMVIRFNKIIEKKIPNFIGKLTTEEERSGLFNYAMTGLLRLLEQGQFSYAKSAIDTKLEMMRSGSSIAQFASEAVEEQAGAEITKEKMYDEYVSFCTRGSLATETRDLFGKKFPFYVSYVSDKTMYAIDGTKKTRVNGYANVVLKSHKEAEVEAVNSFEGFENEEIRQENLTDSKDFGAFSEIVDKPLA